MFTLLFSAVGDVSTNIPQSQRQEPTILQSCLSLKLAGSALWCTAEALSEQTHPQVETASTCQLLFSTVLLPNGRLGCMHVPYHQIFFWKPLGTSWLYMRQHNLQSCTILLYIFPTMHSQGLVDGPIWIRLPLETSTPLLQEQVCLVLSWQGHGV